LPSPCSSGKFGRSWPNFPWKCAASLQLVPVRLQIQLATTGELPARIEKFRSPTSLHSYPQSCPVAQVWSLRFPTLFLLLRRYNLLPLSRLTRPHSCKVRTVSLDAALPANTRARASSVVRLSCTTRSGSPSIVTSLYLPPRLSMDYDGYALGWKQNVQYGYERVGCCKCHVLKHRAALQVFGVTLQARRKGEGDQKSEEAYRTC
jgi:hypothetical protein